MTQQTKARLATALIIAGAVAVVLWREQKLPQPSAPQVAQPHDALYQMLDAVRDGNATAYLDAHTGSVAESLRRAIAEIGEAKFVESLQRQNKPLKGIAVNDPETISPTQAKARVEYVFADRNEIQTVYFESTAGKWRISRVDGAERIRTVIPYGTPVN
jgi:hypothetical protein